MIAPCGVCGSTRRGKDKAQRCLDCNNRRNRAWQEANPGYVRPGYTKERRAQQGREYNSRVRLQALAAYGGKCVCCGEDRHQFLQLDHPNRDGAAVRTSLGRGRNGAAGRLTYADLRRRGWPEGEVRVLCANCHWAIDVFGGCPHESA